MQQSAPNLPRNLGGYRLVERIGAGGMGIVYRAEDPRNHTIVAVKVIHEHLRNDRYVERFRNEAHLASLLTSPYIVRVLEFGIGEGEYYLVTEFVQGTKLADLIDRGRIDIEQALAIAIEVAMALQAAAVQRIVHRDIKPDNIIITPDGSLKLMDFGIARLSYVETQQLFLGTVSYAAPEQFNGRTDVRSDIYSLGIVLFQLLTGELPFRSNTLAELMRLHQEGEPPLARLPGPAILRQLVAKCLEKDPNQRYQDPSSLLEALHEVRRGLTAVDSDAWLTQTITNIVATAVSAQPMATPATVISPRRTPEPSPVSPIPLPQPTISKAKLDLRLLAAAGVLVAVVVAAVVLLSGGGDQPKPLPAEQAAAEATVPAPPAAATAVPIPAPAVPAGWRRFSSSGLELSLPPAYQGGEPTSADVDAYATAIQVQGLLGVAATIEFIKPNMKLLLYDNDSADLGTNVNVTRFANAVSQGMEALTDQQSNNLTNAGFRVVERTSASIGGLEVRRLRAEVRTTVTVQYLYKKGDILWIVAYNTYQSIYERLRPSFEQSAQTVRISD